MESNIRKRMLENEKIDECNIICKFPRKMLLEPTNVCNDSCLFCGNSKCTKKKGFINKNLAIKVLSEAYNLGIREVGFYGTGEPLLDKNLEDYILYAKNLGFEYTYITTNGSLLSEERAKSIIDAGIDSIKFSINASNPKDYYLIHGKDEFNKVIENLIYLDALRKQKDKKVALYISYVSTRYTCQNKESFRNLYQNYVDDIVFDDCMNVSGYMANEIKQYLSVDQMIRYHPQNDICPMIFNCLYVTYEGYLTMCCQDFQNYLAVADLNRENLGEAWNNEYAQRLRKCHLDHNINGTLCFNCMNDCNVSVKPLNPKLSIYYDNKSWSKAGEIEERIHRWSLL